MQKILTRKKRFLFQHSIADIVNNKSDLRKLLLNQAFVPRVLDQKNKGVFESPMPLSIRFKDTKVFDIKKPNAFII